MVIIIKSVNKSMAEVADVRQTNTASFESVALYQQPLCVYVYTHTHTHTHTHST